MMSLFECFVVAKSNITKIYNWIYQNTYQNCHNRKFYFILYDNLYNILLEQF